jgi:hypothetical protein
MRSKIKTGGQGVDDDGDWMRSSFTTPNNNCVELRLGCAGVGVRDSKDVTGGMLEFGRREWSTFLFGIVR